jgi:hypothetical protein
MTRLSAGVLREPFLERALDGIYLPESKRVNHYFDTRMSEQFDAAF